MEGGSVQQAPPSMLNVFGVDPKHFNKWLRVWEEKRPYGQVQPDPQHPKKLNTVATDFLLRTAKSKQWRPRAVVLRGHYLYYFRYPIKSESTPCRGVILVKGCAITTFQNFEGKTNVLLLGPNTTRKPGWRPDLTRRFYFSLSSQAELAKWYQMLKLAAHTEKTYNKYMVKTVTYPSTPPPAPPTAASSSSPLPADKGQKAEVSRDDQSDDHGARSDQQADEASQSPSPRPSNTTKSKKKGKKKGSSSSDEKAEA